MKIDKSLIYDYIFDEQQDVVEVHSPFPEVEGLEFRHVPGFPGYAVDSDGYVWTCLTKESVSFDGKLYGEWRYARMSYHDIYTLDKYKKSERPAGSPPVPNRGKGDARPDNDVDFHLFVYMFGKRTKQLWIDIWELVYPGVAPPLVHNPTPHQMGVKNLLGGRLRPNFKTRKRTRAYKMRPGVHRVCNRVKGSFNPPRFSKKEMVAMRCPRCREREWEVVLKDGHTSIFSSSHRESVETVRCLACGHESNFFDFEATAGRGLYPILKEMHRIYLDVKALKEVSKDDLMHLVMTIEQLELAFKELRM